MKQSHARKQAGFTLVEICFAMLILVICAAVLIKHLTINYQTTATQRDRVFAYTKAQAILSEIQGFVDRGQVDAAVDLDVLDDGVVNKAALTIATEPGGSLVIPDHPLSGNITRNGDWLWSRRITVQPFAGIDNRNVRYVTVRILRKDDNGVDRSMADLSAVINSKGGAFPTTQVFDVYLLAVENIPGWWVFMDSMKPFVESMITDLETRNPGLSFRTHWITKASFGRNAGYRPYANEANDSHQPIGEVYHYPGRMPAGNASTFYYVPSSMRGRINVDGTERHGWHDDLNPHPYALADFFNHAMRYPEELALWQARVQAVEAREQEIADAVAAGATPPSELDDMSKEPTLRLFIEDLCTNPDKYRNALVINLHGELLPMPALRNYSDAARDPVSHPQWRVVTHPEELRTHRDPSGAATDALRLRMYAYRADARTYTGTELRMTEPMVVDVVGMNLTDSTQPTKLNALATLRHLPGGVPVPMPSGPQNYSPAWLPAKHLSDSPAAGEMHYTAEFVDPATSGAERFTRIYLFNTPLVARPVTQGGQTYGLANTEQAQLYWMPYIPCPIAAGPSFATDLSTSGAGPKNTARWTLTVAPAAFTTANTFINDLGDSYTPTDDVLVKVRTRIATGYGTSTAWQDSGTMWPPADRTMPDNLSVTYAWWADSREDVPVTERSQFNGDPRHVPYKDCFNGTIGTNGVDYPNSYNWYHDSLNNGGENSVANYPSINSAVLRNRWNASMSADVPRYFEVLRTGLTRSATVYTTLTGFSYYYLGIGDDIGYDSANGYPNSIPSNLTPHGSPGSNGFVNTITGSRRFVRSTGSTYWWGMPWLGELYPDTAAAAWVANDAGGNMRGNLAAGTGSGQFYQGTVSSVHGGSNRTAYGTAINDYHQRTSTCGCTTFFNIGTATSSFHHTGSTGNGALTSVGTELANNYNMTMPTTAPITRPFGLNWNGATGEEWNYAPYSSSRYTASMFRTYYNHSAGLGSGLVKLVDTGNTSASYIVVNGISNAVDNGTTFIAKYAMLSLVHSFFEAGSTTNTLRIPQLARLEIEAPTDVTELIDPTTIDIVYDIEWTRWDGQNYSATGTFSEDESLLQYVVMYSRDGGRTWLHIQDDTRATAGTRPTDTSYLLADSGPGAETFTWNVPESSYPEGSYGLRVDCYRRGASVHYSFHQAKIFVQR